MSSKSFDKFLDHFLDMISIPDGKALHQPSKGFCPKETIPPQNSNQIKRLGTDGAAVMTGMHIRWIHWDGTQMLSKNLT